MTRVGFIGPGIMGMPMAANLVHAGHHVLCYGRSPSARARAQQSGAEVVDSVSDACQHSDYVITMLPDSPDVLGVAIGPDGVLANMTAGTCFIDCSTISPHASRDLHQAAANHDLQSLDAPVSGGEAAAIEGTLSIMVGGDQQTYDAAQPILRAVGSTIARVGAPGSGQVVKAANQLIVAGNIQLLAEAIVFLTAHDADLDAAFDVLGGGLAGSTVLNRKRKNFLDSDFTPGFRVALHDKDLGIIQAAAREKGLSLPVTALLTAMMSALRARGAADLDHSALLQLARDLNAQPAKRNTVGGTPER